MGEKEIVIRTGSDLQTEIEIMGVKGTSCTKILEVLQMQMKDIRQTEEYHLPEEQYIVTGS